MEIVIKSCPCPHCQKDTLTVVAEFPKSGLYICTNCLREPTCKEQVRKEIRFQIIPHLGEKKDLLYIEEEWLAECNDPSFFVPITDAEFSNMLRAMEQIRPMTSEQETE